MPTIDLSSGSSSSSTRPRFSSKPEDEDEQEDEEERGNLDVPSYCDLRHQRRRLH